MDPSSHLSKLPGNKQVFHFFGEPFYVWPKSYKKLGFGSVRLYRAYMDVSKNRGTPKSSILIGFSIINHPFWGFYPYFWVDTHMLTLVWAFFQKTVDFPFPFHPVSHLGERLQQGFLRARAQATLLGKPQKRLDVPGQEVNGSMP